MLPVIVLLLLLPWLGIKFPSVLTNQKVRIIIFVVLLLILAFSFYIRTWPLELYAIAIVIILSQISLIGHQYWMSRILTRSQPGNIAPFTKAEAKFTIWTALFCWVGAVLIGTVGTHFVFPALLVVLFGLIVGKCVKGPRSFLVPAAAIYFADAGWQLTKIVRYYDLLTLTDIVPIVTFAILIVIGVIWLIKKPGKYPILYLSILQVSSFMTSVAALFGHDFITRNPINFNFIIMIGAIIFFLIWKLVIPLWLAIVGTNHFKTAEAASMPMVLPQAGDH